MKYALVSDRLVPAASDAPTKAICPSCGSVVELRSRQGTYFWRHLKLPRGGCSPEQPAAAELAVLAADGEGVAQRRLTRQLGNFAIELHPAESPEPYLVLRNLRTEEAGEPSETVICFSDLQPLAQALLDLAAELESSDERDK